MSVGYLAVKNDQYAQINNAECLSVGDMTQVKMPLKYIMHLILMWETNTDFFNAAKRRTSHLS